MQVVGYQLGQHCCAAVATPIRLTSLAQIRVADSLGSPMTRLWLALSVIPDHDGAGIWITTTFCLAFSARTLGHQVAAKQNSVVSKSRTAAT